MSQEFDWLLKEKYGGVKSDAFYADFKRLSLGEPLGYLIGHVPFLGCQIWLDSRPLIPRPETEFWTEKAITAIDEYLKHSPEARPQAETENPPEARPRDEIRVLDLCAGSGCVGVAVAKAVAGIRVDFSEIDAKHIPTIKKNLIENNISEDRCGVYQTNLFTDLTGTYDFILANPPYINADLNQTDDSVVDFEPHLALFGGALGLEIIDQLITAAGAYVSPGGQLWIEHDPEQGNAIKAIAEKNGFSCITHHDQYAVERYSILVLQ